MTVVVSPSVRPPHHRVGRLPRSARALEAAGLVLIGTFALWLRATNLDAYTGSFDEGIRSQQLLLMSAGYRPFREIFSSQGPLLLDALFPFYVLFGQTLAATRAGVVIFSLVGLLAMWWVGRLVAGPLAGLAAAAILALSPGYLEGSRLALAEVPTIAPALLALGALLAFRQRSERRWLLVSALLCALALLIKPMVVHVLVPLGLLLAMPGRIQHGERGEAGVTFRPGLGQTVREIVLYAAVVAAACAVTILALGPAEVWNNLGAYRSGAGGAVGSDLMGNLRLTANLMARERAWLFILAALGTALGLIAHPRSLVPIAAWAGAILAMFALYGDLADKHIVYLVPPIALLAAAGVALPLGEVLHAGSVSTPRGISLPRASRPSSVILSAAKDLKSRRLAVWPPCRSFAALRMTSKDGMSRGREVLLSVAATIGLTAAALYVALDLPALYRAERFIVFEAEQVAERRRDRASELEIVQTIEQYSAPEDWVLSDNPGAAFEAGRKVIPSLADTSGTRVDAGSLTSAMVREAVDAYRPAVIVTWSRRLGRLDEFILWLPGSGYRLERTYDTGWRVYLRG